MNSQDKAKITYLRITSHAPYSEMNGISREWFEKKIAEALDEWAIEVFKWALENGLDLSVGYKINGAYLDSKELYQEYLTEINKQP